MRTYSAMNARAWLLAFCGVLSYLGLTLAQPPGGERGFGGPPGGAQRKILKDYDKDHNGWLDNEERKAARAELKKTERRGPRGGMFGGRGETPKPGPKLEPADVPTYSDKSLYDPGTLRTFFITFENPDWEKELEDFHGTDVDVPCTLHVDGKTYNNVGVHFRGMSSYMGVPTGFKRSLNLSLDLADKKQRLYGAKTINLLNCHGDESLLSSVLYSHIARNYIPTPKANMARVVINGECWGIYSNVQQFDKEFLKENYKTDKGYRWKVRGSPGVRGGLEYFGDNPESYKRIFELKTGSGDDEKAWKALINLCKVLNQTPPDQLEEALKPILDIDNVLWFLAIDVALINSDGYWTRSSDYSLWLDPKGIFHIIPHDMNEAFHGSGGGPGGFILAFPAPGEILSVMFRDQLRLTDEQKKQVDALQKETEEKLAKILTEEQRKQLKELKDQPMRLAGGPGGPGGGPGGRGGGGPMGMGGPGGPGGAGIRLDPLVGLTDDRKPLRSKLLAVPTLKARYLSYVRRIAEESLDWKKLGPVVAQYRSLLEKEVERDAKRMTPADGFKRATADDAKEGRGREMPLRAFADQRRAYLLEVTAKK